MRLVSTLWPYWECEEHMLVVADVPVYSAKFLPRLDPDDLFHIHDCFDLRYMNYFFPNIAEVKPRAILNDHWTVRQRMFPEVPIYTIPAFAAKFAKTCRLLDFGTDFHTAHSCNVMVNRFGLNRWAALQFLQLFDIDFDYTYSGSRRQLDLADYLDKLTPQYLGSRFTPEHRNFMLAPVTLPTRWIDYTGQQLEYNQSGSLISVQKYGGNFWTWCHGLNDLFSRSAVSVVTESSSEMPGVVFTEKTIYAILGLTMPIWVGHATAPDHWRSYGFDIFDDVINHDYQYESEPLMRYWRAFELNAEILRDKQRLADLRNSHKARLLRNRDLLLSGQLEAESRKIINSWPREIEQLARPVMRDRFDLDL